LLTEIGTLELSCVAEKSRERWRLEFELRGASSPGAAGVTESMPPAFAEARQWVELIFGGKPGAHRPAASARGIPPKDVKQLWTCLERTLGPREDWRPPVLRELWSTLFAGAARRRRSADHERIYFQLLGYTLRPGFGYPLDDWRAEQTARLFAESVQFHQDKAVWNEFWILWRRIAGGLSEARHTEIWALLKPFLAARIASHGKKTFARPKGPQPEGLEEMARLAAALEHLEFVEKAELGSWIIARLKAGSSASGPWTWALGRIGARAPLYGSIHKALAPAQVTQWIPVLLDPKLAAPEGALFALAQIARLTGDRTRDLDDSVRHQVLAALGASDAPPSWERIVSEIVPLETADKARALGDTLPVGLSLI
jgi:hypothetical protein